jgi:hypothetical protein
MTVTDLLILAAHIEDRLDLIAQRLDEIDHALEATR